MPDKEQDILPNKEQGVLVENKYSKTYWDAHEDHIPPITTGLWNLSTRDLTHSPHSQLTSHIKAPGAFSLGTSHTNHAHILPPCTNLQLPKSMCYLERMLKKIE